MISDEQTHFIMKLAREQLEKNGEINFNAIKKQFLLKFHESYSPKLLRNLYYSEENNPQFMPKEVDKPYLDLKQPKKGEN